MPLANWERVDRNDPAYKACLGLTSAAGAVIGGATGSPALVLGMTAGYVAGAAWGLAIGYLACPYLIPHVRSKIESGTFLTDSELRSAAEALASYAGVQDAPAGVKLLAIVKLRLAAAPGNGPACQHPAIVAQELLRLS